MLENYCVYTYGELVHFHSVVTYEYKILFVSATSRSILGWFFSYLYGSRQINLKEPVLRSLRVTHLTAIVRKFKGFL